MDMCNRIVKNSVKVMQGKETIPNLFDEAQFIVFKEILPYWAGFMKTYQPPADITFMPSKCETRCRKNNVPRGVETYF